MKEIKLAYFGSPDFSADFLEKILLDKSLPVAVKLVVTQPDQPIGRKQILTPTSVKVIAKKYGLECLVIENCKLKIENFDLCLVYAFGELIPKEILDLPKYGFWNIHPSLLPKYRGVAPIAYPLILGDKTTGVTIIKMDEEIDHGPIITQQSLTIEKTDKRPDLEKKLTNLAFEMFKKTAFNKDSLQLKPQDHTLATYTKKLSKNDGFIKFDKLKQSINNPQLTINNLVIYNLFRGLYPWPGIWIMIKPIQLRQLYEAKRLKITDMDFIDGKLVIKKVQLEGKKEVDFETFNKAYKIF